MGGGVDGGVDAQLFAAAKNLGHECGMHKGCTAGDGHSPAHGFENALIARDAGHDLVNGVHCAVPHLPRVRVVAILTAQHASGQEERQAGAGTVHSCYQLPGVHRTQFAGAHRGEGVGAALFAFHGVSNSSGGHSLLLYSAPWNVRFSTSNCCSRVRRTKFTAYPETRIVSCGESSWVSIASSSVSLLRTLMLRWTPSEML